MFKTFLLTSLLATFTIAACHSNKPVESTTTRTTTTTQDNTGEVKHADVTTQTTENADGTQTVKTNESSSHTTPAPPPAPMK